MAITTTRRDPTNSPLVPAGTRSDNPALYKSGGSTAQRQPYTGTLTGGNLTQPQGGYTGAFDPNTANPWAPKPPSPLTAPGNNLTNPGYDEQALHLTQNRLLEDPFGGYQQNYAQQAGQASQGEGYLNQNLGSLNGPGEGEQYWNQVQGQFQDPFAGEQYARQATQNMTPNGPASAFYDQAMGQYGDFTGYSGPQNAQGQYGQAQQQLGNGTQGQQGLSQLAGQYDQIGQYGDPNLAAGQYAQTQGAFGDMPIANFDPFYDRARQLGVQSYNQGAAGRGVYGSSEALSGVGNVITDIEAQRANRSFDAEMQRAQEQRMRQQLLGEQARAGDLSSLAAFGANLAGVETFGNLNNQMGQLQNQSQEILGNMANNADSQALGAQNANIAGLNAFGDLANNADSRETDRYEATTTAMNNADRTGIDRLRAGADIADMADDNARGDYDSSMNAATSAANVRNNRLQTGSNIASTGSRDDLARVEGFNDAAAGAEDSRMDRIREGNRMTEASQRIVQDILSSGMGDVFQGDQEAFDDYVTSQLVPKLQAAGLSQQQIDQEIETIRNIFQGGVTSAERALEDDD
jgi:hypothetical protein